MTSDQEERNKLLVKSFIDDIFNKHDLSATRKYFVTDTTKDKTLTEQGNNIFKQTLTAFPDIQANIEQILAENDLVMVFINFTGTHKGEYKGMSPTNKPIKIRSADLYRLENEKIVEHWDVVDQSGVKPYS